MRLKNKEKQNIKLRLEALIDAYGVDNVAKIFYQILRDMMFDKSCKTCKSRKSHKMAIKASEQTRWIPCSEKLPTENDTYEVTLRGISELEGTTEIAYAKWLNNDWLYHNVDDWQYKKVTAWKTRTQPYKPESEEVE